MKRTGLIALTLPVLVAVFSVGWATQHRSQGPLFVPAPGSPVTVGPGSGEVVLADLNHDGHVDMLTKHLLQKCVTMRLGDGKGHFAPSAESPLSFGYMPGTIALADINNDTILDLGVASKDDEREYVNIFLGNGRGGFKPSGSPYTVSSSIETYKPGLFLVDIKEDGKLDIVTANGRRNSIEILFGDGRAGFSVGPILKLHSGQNRYYSALGDVDRDGHLDVVTVSSSEQGGSASYLEIKRGNGRGSFTDEPRSPLTVPPSPRLGTLADVNGDQHLDIVLSHSSSHLSVLVNNGKGIFTPAPASPYNTGTEAFAVVVADVNGDKKNDLVAATVNSVTVLLSDGRGFVPAPGSPFRAGPGAYNLTVGDLNKDGKLDVVASSFEGNDVTVLLGR